MTLKHLDYVQFTRDLRADDILALMPAKTPKNRLVAGTRGTIVDIPAEGIYTVEIATLGSECLVDVKADVLGMAEIDPSEEPPHFDVSASGEVILHDKLPSK